MPEVILKAAETAIRVLAMEINALQRWKITIEQNIDVCETSVQALRSVRAQLVSGETLLERHKEDLERQVQEARGG